MLSSPLNDEEYERLEAVLRSFHEEHAMNLEEVDGFFALLCSPEMVPPSEYLPEIWGGETLGTPWKDKEEFQDFIGLLMRHWNSVARTLDSGEIYLPYLIQETSGVAHGNDWAQGFMRGVSLREDHWRGLFRDEEKFGMLLPILALFHEYDEDPEMRPYKEPVSVEQREKLLSGIAASVNIIYRHLAADRKMFAASAVMSSSPQRNAERKIGRNELCPCGSGKKYKRCCGDATVH